MRFAAGALGTGLRLHNHSKPLNFFGGRRNMRRTIFILAGACASFACSAVSTSGTDKKNSDTLMANSALLLAGAVLTSGPDIRGTWRDNAFMTNLNLGQAGGTWLAHGTGSGYSFTYALRAYDNSANKFYYECISQTGSGCTVGKFGAVMWTDPASNSFYWCEYAFNLTSTSAAQSASSSSAVPSNLASGCNGFSWTKYDKI